MHLALCTMPLQYLCEQPDVASGREHGSGFVLPDQAAQRKASRGDARQDKPSRCVGQARRERCPLVLKNTVVVFCCGLAFIFKSYLWGLHSPLKPSDVICRHRSRSTMAQAMGSGNGFLSDGTKPLPKPVLIINEVLRRSPGGDFAKKDSDMYHWCEFDKY